jgi:hypothetical protein
MNDDMTLTQAAEYMGLTRQAVYIAIKTKKMTGYKKDGMWFVSQKEINGYMGRRYNRTYSTWKNGKPKFDKDKGELCTREVSERLKIPMQKAYYMIRTGRLRSLRKGASYVVLIKDLEEAKKILNNNLNPVVPMSSYDRTQSNGQSDSLGSA